MDQVALSRLKNEKQFFFLPYWRSVVGRHPLGIRNTDVKALAREAIKNEHGFDPFDTDLTGLNPSTNDSRASQWANNLISNHDLEPYMLVVRNGSVVLFPLSADDNSVPTGDPAPDSAHLDSHLIAAANKRAPRRSERAGTGYLRSAAAAEWVRKHAGHRCVIGSSDCVRFEGRNNRPYIEVHHIIPMSMQDGTAYNLDSTVNMVAICVGCHTKLHRGSRAQAGATLGLLLDNYTTTRGQNLQTAMAKCSLPSSSVDLLGYYER